MATDMLFAISGMFVLTAIVVGWGTAAWLTARSPEHQRLRTMTTGSPLVVEPSRPLEADTVDPTLARLSKLLPRSAREMSRLQRRLARAGYRGPHGAVYYSIAEIVLPAVAGGAVLLWLGWNTTAIVLGLCAMVLAFLVPQMFVDHAIRARQQTLRRSLPDALDLMTLCVEAGNGLDQAIAKTAEEIRLAHPVLSDELQMVTTEIRAGMPRLEAFRNFAERTGLDEVRALAAMLMQTDRFGTSIGQALRTHAETSRTERRQAAEERAGKVSVKLVFPLALCLFPALYVVCFGPVAVRIFRALIAVRP